MRDADRQAIHRFLHAIVNKKKASPEDCRAAARFIVEQRGFRLWQPLLELAYAPTRRGRHSAADQWKAIADAAALRRVVGERDPTPSELRRVAKERHVSVSTVRRHWEKHR